MFKLIINAFYTVIILALIAVASLATLSAFPVVNGFRIFVVQTGSMEPAIKTKSIVAVSSASTYEVGDVITYKVDSTADLNNPRSSITHRIIEVQENESGTSFITQGDANEAADLTPVRQDQIVGKVRASIPYLGYPVGFAKTQTGFIILVIIPATLIIYSEIMAMKSEIKRLLRERKEKSGSKKDQSEKSAESHSEILSTFAFPIMLTGMVLVFGAAKMTLASFSDKSTFSGASITTAEDFEPDFAPRRFEVGEFNFSPDVYSFEEELVIVPAEEVAEAEQDEQESSSTPTPSPVASIEPAASLPPTASPSTTPEPSTDVTNEEQEKVAVVTLNQQDNSSVALKLENIEDYSSFEYVVTYFHTVDAQVIQEAVQGSNEITEPTYIKSDIYLGTCSTGGIVCVPHTGIKNVKVEVYLNTASAEPTALTFELSDWLSLEESL